MRLFWITLLLLLPQGVNAAVYISEVAWMGSAESANHEWIELHNDGEATDISGWFIRDGMNLNIELSGTIPANTHVVLERTSDASAPGAAFLTYPGALVNTGATLRLERGDGSLVDQVAGGDNWENIGGDNVTKETAQYTTSGWKTAISTPGNSLVWNEQAANEQAKKAEKDTSNPVSALVAKKSSNSSEPVRLVIPGVTLLLKVDAQTVGYVNQQISFTVEPSGIGDTLIDSLTYQWNFGDGSTDTEKDPQHIFHYPGTYVVTVYGSFKRQEQVGRHEITILPVKASLTMNQEGDVQINNNSPYELDISGYRLRSDKVFTFPPYSILLPNQTITIPRYKLGQTKSRMIVLYDTESAVVTSLSPNSLTSNSVYSEEVIAKPKISSISASRSTIASQSSGFTFAAPKAFASEGTEEVGEEWSEPISLDTTTQVASVGATAPWSDSRFSYLALAGVLGLAIFGVFVAPRRRADIEKKVTEGGIAKILKK